MSGRCLCSLMPPWYISIRGNKWEGELYATKHHPVYGCAFSCYYYSDVIMIPMVSQITGVSTVCSAVCSNEVQRNYHSSASLAFVRGIRRWPVYPPHKEPVTPKVFSFDDVIVYVYVTYAPHLSPHVLCHTNLDLMGSTQYTPWNKHTLCCYMFHYG